MQRKTFLVSAFSIAISTSSFAMTAAEFKVKRDRESLNNDLRQTSTACQRVTGVKNIDLKGTIGNGAQIEHIGRTCKIISESIRLVCSSVDKKLEQAELVRLGDFLAGIKTITCNHADNPTSPVAITLKNQNNLVVSINQNNVPKDQIACWFAQNQKIASNSLLDRCRK